MGKFRWLPLLSASVLMTGCMSAYLPPSAEERAAQQEIMNRIFSVQQGKFQPQQANNNPASAQTSATISESELLQKINSFPALNKKVKFSKKKDGLEINGRKLIDIEGPIKFYGFDPMTGDVTYLVATGNDRFDAKYVRATSGMEPVKIGEAVFNNGWQLRTVTGKKLGGDKLIPLGKGFIITREDGNGFAWSPDRPMQSFNAPEGFQIADFQNGDISGTKYILCERMIAADEAEGTFGKVFSAAKNLGSTLGMNNKEDYSLLNIETGAVVPINISYDKKNVAVHSNCQPTSKFVNKCGNVQFYDSLYDLDGNPNRGHYYWSINWYNTQAGPMLIFMDNNGRDLYAQNLKNNDKAIILSRMLGINWFTSTQGADGVVSVEAKMGFSSESVDNVEKTLTLKLAEKISSAK